MKKILFFFFLYLAYHSYSQVGIGNSTPRGALDINRPTTNTYGLVLPTNSSVTNIVNPRGGAIAPATTIYESSNDCIRHYRQSAWSNCLLTENGSLFNISKVEQASTFTGTYKSNVAMTTANTYVVGIKNESPTAVSITLSTFDLKLSGVEGISVASVAPATVTIQPGQTALATYRLTGTPTTCGTLTGTWNKMKLNHTATVNVLANPTYQCNLGSWNNTVAPEYRINGLIPGVSYTGTYTIPYTGSSESDCELQLPAETITQNGLTLTYPGGPVSSTGTITYTLSGTYTGAAYGAAVTFTTSSGCQIYLGPCSSCKQLLELFPGTPDGVYKIDPDQGLTAFGTMNAQCDMTTDGGGWTMVLNYLHRAGTSPATTVRTYLPVIGSSTLGTNEAGNASIWGHGNRALQATLKPTEYRFYGITSGHNRVMHFKTAHAGSITYFTTGVGNASGIQNSFTPLTGHTTNLPATATNFDNAGANNELSIYPFYRPNFYWNIGLSNVYWHVDDGNTTDITSTLHRVWVR